MSLRRNQPSGPNPAPAAGEPSEQASVSDVVAQWAAVRPDLTPGLAAMATIGRLGRLHAIMRRRIEEVHERNGLTLGEFDVLAALRRGGAPYQARPIDLARWVMLSPAGITNRLDRLEMAGWVTRRHDQSDRRSFIVGLTDAGFELIDRAVTDHVDNEVRLLSALSERERAALDRAVDRLIVSMSSPD